MHSTQTHTCQERGCETRQGVREEGKEGGQETVEFNLAHGFYDPPRTACGCAVVDEATQVDRGRGVGGWHCRSGVVADVTHH